MWPSELARQLNVSPGVISKRLSVYRTEAGLERQDTLDKQTINHMTEMHLLLMAHATMTVREATLRVLGQWINPVTAQEAHLLTQRVQEIQDRLTGMERMLAEVHDIVTSRDRRRRDAAEQGQPTLDWAASPAENPQLSGVGQG
ncbi:hypothetical protein [Deinococcus marmoris]|uniref:Uncharacterized protein n=1 Tax=Deinococcus marmoris TaxID=249408 RepID=A0A1U7P230_9DEIO|nr:hypothetical protein [Deinococcus marmoris]OLV19219.1 hypothetical protein BOO71_0003448 [Deinococcus marmoris]